MNRFIKLREIVHRVKVGFVGSINEFYTNRNNGIPLLRTSDLTETGLNFESIKYVLQEFHDKNRKSQVRKGDLIVARHGDNGKVNVFDEDFDCQVLNAVIIEPNQELIDSISLKYILESPFIIKQIKGCVKGSVQGVINTAHISELLIPYSSQFNYKIQYNILKLIDEKITVNNQINTQLEAMAKTLYDYWFVQFDFPFDFAQGEPLEFGPFDSAQGPASQNAPEADENRAVAEQHSPVADRRSLVANENTPVADRSRGYKSSGGKMVYNEVLKREIPEGWEVTVFNDWINKTKTGDWGKEEVEGNYTERVHCVRGADINGLNGKGDVKAPVRYILKNNLSKALQPNDFIVEISGGSPVQSTGRIALLTEESFERFDSNVICSNFCKAISLKDKKYVFNFKQEWQRLYDAGVFFGYEGKTSGIKNFLFDSFMDTYHIVKPSKEIAKKYHQFVSSLEKKKQLSLLQNQQLAQLRDWLLPMLMNGQVTVGEAEEKLGMVAEEKMAYSNNLNK